MSHTEHQPQSNQSEKKEAPSFGRKAVIEAFAKAVHQKKQQLEKFGSSMADTAQQMDGRNQSRYDTQGVETGWLANAIYIVAHDLGFDPSTYELTDAPQAVGVGSLVCVRELIEEIEGMDEWYFMVENNGGEHVTVDTTPVQSLSIKAPLGQFLLGKQVGEITTYQLNNGVELSFKIADIAVE